MDKYFTESDERVYLDLRVSESYTVELEKLKEDKSDLVLKITRYNK